MKTFAVLMMLTLALPVAANAAALCPKDSCNPANGCLEGCTTQQQTCAYNSVPQCAGSPVYSACTRTTNEDEWIGYCTPISTALPAACDCE